MSEEKKCCSCSKWFGVLLIVNTLILIGLCLKLCGFCPMSNCPLSTKKTMICPVSKTSVPGGQPLMDQAQQAMPQ